MLQRMNRWISIVVILMLCLSILPPASASPIGLASEPSAPQAVTAPSSAAPLAADRVSPKTDGGQCLTVNGTDPGAASGLALDSCQGTPGEVRTGIDAQFLAPLTKDLAVQKTLAPGQPGEVAPGSDVVYQITVSNPGDEAATNVQVKDTVPVSFTLSPSGNTNWTAGYRYVRFRGLSEAGNRGAWLSMSELGLLDGTGAQISKAGWLVTYYDNQQNSTDQAAANAIDNNPATIWHTAWSGTPGYPHEIQVDTGAVRTLAGFTYLPRQDGNSNGRVGDFQFYVSEDGVTWVQAAQGTFADTASLKTVNFAPPALYATLAGPIAPGATATLTITLRADALARGMYINTATLTAGDANSANNTGIATVQVGPNRTPVAVNDSYDRSSGAQLIIPAPGVLANDTDADRNPLTAVKVSDPAHGAVTLNANGSFTYTPTVGFVDDDSFTYKANDGAADSPVATVTIKGRKLIENFESGVLPAGWQVSGTTQGWRFDDPKRRTNLTGGTGKFAIVDSDYEGYVKITTTLRTPPLDLSAAASVRLTFKTMFRPYQTSTADVDVSVDNGATWTNIWRKTGADYNGTISLLVPQAVGQSTVLFRFHYYNADFAFYWLVDDVEVQAFTLPAAPGALGAVVADPSVNLTWTDNSVDESNFIIERSPDGASGWVEAGRVAANVTAFTHKNVACGTPVTYRVKAIAGSLQSGYSNSANITMPPCPPPLTTINEHFDASQSLPAGWTLVDGGWVFDQPNQTGATGYAPYIGTGTGGQLRTPVFNMTGINAVLLKFQTKTNLFAGQSVTQTVKVDVSQDGGATWVTAWDKPTAYQGSVVIDLSPWAANQSSVMVRFRRELPYAGTFWQIDDVEFGPMPAPITPADFTATMTAWSEVLLGWSGSDGSKFQVERSADGGSSWTQIANLTDGATTYVDKGTASYTGYQYRVRAYTPAGQSAYSSLASATTGDRSVRYVDVTISLHPTATIGTAADRAKYENSIRYFADVLYEMSNGVHRLGKVTLYRDGKNMDSVNVQWVPSCYPNSHVSGYFSRSNRVLMCDDSPGWWGSLNSDSAQRGAGDTLGHEWGHLFYGMFDEYVFQTGDVASKYTIMAFDWLGWGDYRWFNFSANTPYFSLKTFQGRIFGADAWTTMTRPPEQDPRNSGWPWRLYWPELAAVAPAPGQLPTIELSQTVAITKARENLQIIWVPGFTARVTHGPNAVLTVANGVVREIVIDRSALMADSGYLDEVKAAVATLIDQTPAGDTLGVIAFDGAATVVQPLTDIVDQTTKDTVTAAVNGLAAGNAQAAPGVALQSALTALTAPTVPTDTTRVVYFITAGAHTTGAHAITVVPGFQANGIEVHVFGFDPTDGDQANLHQLTDLTGGEYTTVFGASDLQDAFQMTGDDTSPTLDVVLNSVEAEVAASETYTLPVTVDASLGEVDFEITYFGEPLSATVSLIDPTGAPIPIDSAADCDTWGSGADAETTCYVSRLDPAGNWTVKVVAVDDVYVLITASGVAQAGHSTYDATITSPDGDVVDYPQPIVIEASVKDSYPIAGLAAAGSIHGQGGTELAVNLHDDGVAPDRIANDGVYAGYVDYTQDGEQIVTVHFDNAAGTGFYTDLGLMTTDPEPLPAVSENFERYAEYQITVRGWQADDHADWPADPDRPATAVTPDNIAVHGRIDFENDVDVFKITVPANYTNTLGLRIDRLGLDMDPYVVVYPADHAWEFERYIDYTPTSDDSLFVPLDVTPGETYYVEVWHWEETAATGTYDVSAGPYLWSDPIAKEKVVYKVMLPLIRR
ncbi:MAG: discoidin domain-containing protein [Chloroflexi bacterium]|nr:discoidin domain-containing protein [Chloroflexota bacterium]